MKKIIILIFCSMMISMKVLASPLLNKRSWPAVSTPLRMQVEEFHFNLLPLKGKTHNDQKNWSSDFWPRNRGGINYRWNAQNPVGFGYSSPKKEEVALMSLQQRAELSPSEKFDLLSGNYSYPLKRKVSQYAKPNRPFWEGICDGWSAAAFNHSEPLPKILKNPDQIEIPFGSSDIKAILSWYYSKEYSGGYNYMGYRCRYLPWQDRCNEDLNAGAFHLVLAHKIGIKQDSFIADIERGTSVWNHLATEYDSQIIQRDLPPRNDSAPGTSKRVRIKTIVKYVFLVKKNTWDTVLGTSSQRYLNQTYIYDLDLELSGKIIGGQWISKTRPDFLWLEKKSSFKDPQFKLLPLLLND